MKKLDREYLEDLVYQFMIDNEHDYINIHASLGFNGTFLVSINTDIEDE